MRLRNGGGFRLPATLPGFFNITFKGEMGFKMGQDQTLRAAVDMVNVAGNVYEIRDGRSVGLVPGQSGMRRRDAGSHGVSF